MPENRLLKNNSEMVLDATLQSDEILWRCRLVLFFLDFLLSQLPPGHGAQVGALHRQLLRCLLELLWITSGLQHIQRFLAPFPLFLTGTCRASRVCEVTKGARTSLGTTLVRQMKMARYARPCIVGRLTLKLRFWQGAAALVCATATYIIRWWALLGTRIIREIRHVIG